MSLEPHLAFFNSSLLGQPDCLEKIIFALQEKGYVLNGFYVGSYLEPDVNWDINSQSTQRGLEVAYDKHNLTFTVRNESEGFELFIQLDWNIDLDDGNRHAHIGAVTFQTGYFHSDEKTAVLYSRAFLDLGKHMFSLIQPDFGWIDLHEPAGSTWFDDVDRLSIPYVYWANFFGEGYVTKYGIDNFLSSPAWLSEPLNDSGVLVVLSPILGLSNNVEQVKSYFDNMIDEFQ